MIQTAYNHHQILFPTGLAHIQVILTRIATLKKEEVGAHVYSVLHVLPLGEFLVTDQRVAELVQALAQTVHHAPKALTTGVVVVDNL